jgi:hypothetical protein
MNCCGGTKDPVTAFWPEPIASIPSRVLNSAKPVSVDTVVLFSELMVNEVARVPSTDTSPSLVAMFTKTPTGVVT